MTPKDSRKEKLEAWSKSLVQVMEMNSGIGSCLASLKAQNWELLILRVPMRVIDLGWCSKRAYLRAINLGSCLGRVQLTQMVQLMVQLMR